MKQDLRQLEGAVSLNVLHLLGVICLCVLSCFSLFCAPEPRLVVLNIEENFLGHELYFGPQI